jgi:hypothetical protein
MRHSLVLVFLAAFVPACDFVRSPGSGGGDEPARMQAIRSEMEVLARDLSASDGRQCRVLLMGAKPCGGHSTYVLYSKATADSTRMNALAARYTEIERDYNRRTGRISDCAMNPSPEPMLAGGQCAVRR